MICSLLFLPQTAACDSLQAGNAFNYGPKCATPTIPEIEKSPLGRFYVRHYYISRFYELGQVMAAMHLYLGHPCVSWLGFSFGVGCMDHIQPWDSGKAKRTTHALH